ncbi:RmlC-like cupin domain-containing protein [Stachybotrys elegans]|uniref:RmlC-like cupin domain-containing protein n=1 Tax=Stachybotrys elegans TaxID=80388 RepID=A0A8K0T0I3_9HYPO|nr:RmlC-like cupin domain-containing protein [Stachybotrys elegans]
MASLLPIISDILPMIIPAATQVIRARDLEPSHPTVEGPIIQRPAVVDKSDKMCASVVFMARPHQASPIRHNSEQDAIIYAVSGSGILVVKEGFKGQLHRHELSPGDFAFVPAWTEHQLCNETDSDVAFVIFQGGARPVGVELSDWAGQVISQR